MKENGIHSQSIFCAYNFDIKYPAPPTTPPATAPTTVDTAVTVATVAPTTAPPAVTTTANTASLVSGISCQDLNSANNEVNVIPIKAFKQISCN
jgi:hypothetical protein